MVLEFGSVRVVLDDPEQVQAVLRDLLRQLTNREVADILGVTERTVRRWKLAGRLPGAERTTLLALLRTLEARTPPAPQPWAPTCVETVAPAG